MDTQMNEELLYCSKHNVKFEKMGPITFCRLCEKDKFKDRDKYQYVTVGNNVNNKIDYQRIGIPLSYAKASFDNYTVEYTVQKQVYQYIQDFTLNASNGAKSSMLMLGPPGTGKTHLACAMLMKLARMGMRVRYIKSYELVTHFTENWKNNIFFESNEITNFASYDLLVIDEYGFKDQHAFQKAYVEKILFERNENKKPTVLISNMVKTNIQESLGSLLWSRLNHYGLNIQELVWSDYRLELSRDN